MLLMVVWINVRAEEEASLDPVVLRAWWFERQGLMSPSAGATAESILARTGWARSVGGVNPYLTLFTRGGTSREQADAEVRDLEIHELPAARGCTYVVPRSDYAIALRAGQGFAEEAAMSTARKFLGVTDEEIERLMEGVEAALVGGPMDPRELKDTLGGAVRNLGEAGKKRGTTTTLPLALGFLQCAGRIRRLPQNGRLDQQRYRYALWRPSPLDDCSLTCEEARTEMARRYFSWIGPATAGHFQWFSGLGVRAAKDALAPLGLVPMEPGSDYLIHPSDLEELRSYRAPDEPHLALVGSIDGITQLRRDVSALLADEDRERKAAADRGVREISTVLDLSNHAILDRGRLIGLWEYDPAAGEIVWESFVPRSEELKAAVATTEAFIRDQLGDARSFSLDSPESRKPKLDVLRQSAIS